MRKVGLFITGTFVCLFVLVPITNAASRQNFEFPRRTLASTPTPAPTAIPSLDPSPTDAPVDETSLSDIPTPTPQPAAAKTKPAAPTPTPIQTTAASVSDDTKLKTDAATPQNASPVTPTVAKPIMVPLTASELSLLGINYYKDEQLSRDTTRMLEGIALALFAFGMLLVRGPEMIIALREWKSRPGVVKPTQSFSIPYFEF